MEKNDILFIDIDAEITYKDDIGDVLKTGIDLYLNYQFELFEDNWHTFSSYAAVHKIYRLSYDPLSNTYAAFDPVTLEVTTFRSLSQMFLYLSELKQFPLADKVILKESSVLHIEIFLSKDSLPFSLLADYYLTKGWHVNSKVFELPLN